MTYLNNILIYLENKEEHIQYILKVLEYLKQAGLLLKPEKYEFYKKKVDFLGYDISTEDI